jgi:hypothetical protein
MRRRRHRREPDDTAISTESCPERTEGGCLITGNEDGIKHCAMNLL